MEIGSYRDSQAVLSSVSSERPVLCTHDDAIRVSSLGRLNVCFCLPSIYFHRTKLVGIDSSYACGPWPASLSSSLISLVTTFWLAIRIGQLHQSHRPPLMSGCCSRSVFRSLMLRIFWSQATCLELVNQDLRGHKCCTAHFGFSLIIPSPHAYFYGLLLSAGPSRHCL